MTSIDLFFTSFKELYKLKVLDITIFDSKLTNIPGILVN
jgi:hypothetical protein